MPIQDTSHIKEKIISTLKNKGPSLPVHIAQSVEMSPLFTSAFLSELFSEKKLKISNMRVGSSPIYFLHGQENKLERFSQHLKSKEKDAFILLKEKQILEDSIQHPAIKVALRSIKDFAIPFERQGKLYWRYIASPEPEIEIKEKKEIPLIQENIQIMEENKEENIFPKKIPEETTEKKELNIFDKESKESKNEKPKKQTKKKNSSPKKDEKFFNVVKEYISNKSMEIEDIISFNKKELILRIKKSEGQEIIIVAYNQKKVGENEIIKAHKKAKELNLSYSILSLGEPSKKMSTFIEAIKDLKNIQKLE